MATVPALRIPVSADLTKFRQDMQSTSNLGTSAVRSITKSVIEMNGTWLASQGAAGGAALAFGRVLGVLGPIALGVTVISNTFKLMAYATELAKAKIEEFNDVEQKAGGAGVSTDFFQRFTKSGNAAVTSIDDVTVALKRFNDVSKDQLGGSELQQRIDALTKAGNFAGNGGLQALSTATSTEDKLRAVVTLIDQAMAKGERLAALDIAGKAFGEPLANALRADASYLDQMLARADAMSKVNIISQEDVGRALELKNRMEAAEKILADKWKPIQDDLASLGMNYHASWVGITETMAEAVGYATQLYSLIKQVPDWFAKGGNASFWKSLTDATGAMGLNSAPAGMITDPAELAKAPAYDRLRGALQNYGNVTRSMREASNVSSAVRGDTSKAPKPDQVETSNQFDRAADSIAKHTARLRADTEAVGLGASAQERLRAEASLTTAAQQAGMPITEAMTAKIKDLAAGAGQAAEALAKARVGNEIRFGQQTALLSAEDVQIAQSLATIYGNDVPRALASSEAAAMRLNNAIRSANQFGEQTFSNMFVSFGQNLRDGMSAWDSFKNAGLNALGSIADKLMQMAAQQLWMSALGGLGGIFGFSSGGVVGTKMVGDYAMPTVGFDSGGYTGAGGKYQPAGIVHRGEVVFSQADVARHGGVGRVEALRLRGYADGGFVTAPSAPAMSAPAGGGSSGGVEGLHITVGAEVDNNGNLQAYVKDVARTATQQGISSFVSSPQFVSHVGQASTKARQRMIR